MERPATNFPNTVITVCEGEGVPQHTVGVDLSMSKHLSNEEKKEEAKVAAVAEAVAAAELSAGAIDLQKIKVDDKVVEEIKVNGEKIELGVNTSPETTPPVRALPPQYVSFKPLYSVTEDNYCGAKDPEKSN